MQKFWLGGVEFGWGYSTDLVVSSFDPGEAELRSNDSDRPQRSGEIPGRDFEGGSTWLFEVYTITDDVTAALDAAQRLATVWRPRGEAGGKLVPLTYEIAGRQRRVYGRPRRYAGPDGGALTHAGAGHITADFRVMDPLHYDEVESKVTLNIVPASSGGLVAPLVAPLTTTSSGAPRAGFVQNDGDSPTPLRVTFYGPVVNPVVRAAAGWEIGLDGSLAYDQYVTVDALNGTVVRSGGVPVNGMLTRKTRLSKALLPVGQSELTFAGSDITGTARVQLAWRSAFSGI